MPTKKIILQVLVAGVFSAGALSAQAADGRYYDPRNAASPDGYTTDYELNRRIGCPGQSFSGSPCPVDKVLDSDGDGVVDGKDKCPNTPKGRKVNADGCELDSDGDGVVDGADKCPNTPAGRKVNAEGCELDSDGDGVVDGLDKCPNTPAGRKVNAEGCELDTDGDGLVDGEDACPTVYAKTPNGCPPAASHAIPEKLVLEGVHFDNDQATLRPQGFGKLDEVVEQLKQWGDVKVEVAGHTDSNADDAYNLELSDRRAKTVRDYLINHGIAPERLIPRGYGESQPIADNATAEGRLQNRRVELIPQQ